jgi:FlaG/FlaF family flagellin (archaellin)
MSRGVTAVTGVIILVAVVVILSSVVFAFSSGYTDELSEPARVSLSVSQTTISDSNYINENGPPDGCDSLEGPSELAVDVTLSYLDRADEIYVIVNDEGGKRKKVVWDDPSSSDVGTTKTLANEVTAMPGVDVDVGDPGSSTGGYALCPGDDATFRFYARYDGQTLTLQRFQMN